MHRTTDEQDVARARAADDPSRRRSRRGGRAAVVGILGEMLVTLGVLVALFVVWQVWWTDVDVRATQSERVTSIEGPVAPPREPAEPAAPRRTSPPVLEAPGEVGTTFASLRVPRWGERYVMPISEGVSRPDVLDTLGIGHYPGTAMPGAQGNFALAGHRVGFGRPFHAVAALQPGDPLVVRTTDTWYVYRVTASRIVAPTEVAVVAPVPGDPRAEPTEAAITLTTCHPMFSTRDRFVVHGVLDHWLPVADGEPAVLRTDGPRADAPRAGAGAGAGATAKAVAPGRR